MSIPIIGQPQLQALYFTFLAKCSCNTFVVLMGPPSACVGFCETCKTILSAQFPPDTQINVAIVKVPQP